MHMLAIVTTNIFTGFYLVSKEILVLSNYLTGRRTRVKISNVLSAQVRSSWTPDFFSRWSLERTVWSLKAVLVISSHKKANMITLAGQNGVLRLLGLFIDNKLTYACIIKILWNAHRLRGKRASDHEGGDSLADPQYHQFLSEVLILIYHL